MVHVAAIVVHNNPIVILIIGLESLFYPIVPFTYLRRRNPQDTKIADQTPMQANRIPIPSS
jgi:hypothetical protein